MTFDDMSFYCRIINSSFDFERVFAGAAGSERDLLRDFWRTFVSPYSPFLELSPDYYHGTCNTHDWRCGIFESPTSRNVLARRINIIDATIVIF